MKRKITYTDDKGELEGLESYTTLPKDFLPPVEELIFKEKTEKITIELEKSSLDYLKKEAKKHGGSYQRLIRNLISSYAKRLKAA